jgi:hypothetical protein
MWLDGEALPSRLNGWEGGQYGYNLQKPLSFRPKQRFTKCTLANRSRPIVASLPSQARILACKRLAGSKRQTSGREAAYGSQARVRARGPGMPLTELRHCSYAIVFRHIGSQMCRAGVQCFPLSLGYGSFLCCAGTLLFVVTFPRTVDKWISISGRPDSLLSAMSFSRTFAVFQEGACGRPLNSQRKTCWNATLGGIQTTNTF